MTARAVVLALTLCLGCGGPPAAVRAAYADLVTAPEQCRAAAPAFVTPEQMQRDYAVLERALRRGYAGYEQAADAPTWEALFEEGRASLPERPVSPLAFRDRLLDQLRFLDDNHVGLWLYAGGRRRWRSTSGHHQAFLGDARFSRGEAGFVDEEGNTLLSCGDRSPEEALTPVVGEALPARPLAPLVLSREPVEEVTCALRDPAGAPLERTYAMRKVDIRGARGPAFERLDAPFAWLRLRTLFTDRQDALDAFVRTGVELRDEPVIVLDLRRAGGGSDRFLIRWFRNLTAQELRYWDTDALESEVTLQGALSFWGCVRAFSSGADAGGRTWLDNRVARARRELDEAMHERGLFRDRDPQSLRLPGVAPAPYDGRVILVVDRGCGSACETSVMLARQLRGAVIVGENTEGVMKVGELRWYQLPESRIWISLGHRSHHDPFEGFRESFGYSPDLFLDGDDPEAQIAALARCLADDSCGEAVRVR